MKKILCLILLSSQLLAACGEKIENAPAPGTDVQLPPMEWRVRDRRALEAAYLASGVAINEARVGKHRKRDQLSGFVGLDPHGVQVLYTLPPERVDDAVACTIGHEVLHVALGDYHD